MNFKKDFPIFENNPDLIFFDSTATSQKPKFVIDGMKDYLENNYSNIHRGMYDIAITSDNLYKKSKKIVAKNIGAESYKEVIYTYNSTYALNLLSSTIKKSGLLKAGDKVLLSIAEHHANIVPWLILKDEIGIELDFVNVDKNFDLDLEDFDKKYDEKTKVISITHVSNVKGQIFDLKEIGKRKREDTLFIVDGSQSIPHFHVNVSEFNCDFMFFTGHKIMADSGIGVLWGKQELLEKLTPSFSGGGAISEVHCDVFSSAQLPDKFEPGTPNITGAVSLMKAFEYIGNIGGYEVLEKVEENLVKYFLEKVNKYENIKLVGSSKKENRVGVFSLSVDGFHSNDLADHFAEYNIAVRAGKHCAHPLFAKLGVANSMRVSLYLYNTTEEIDKFFEVLDEIIKK